jgi:hypothetical protein
MDQNSDKQNLISNYATYLLFAEIGIGGFLHAAHFPFTGYILSLNQVFLITRALYVSSFYTETQAKLLPCSISIIVALLKSLAPFGKKITPMLAIAMQGILYNVSILLFGNTLLGRILGATLSVLWGFVQPLLIYYLIFGRALYQFLFQILEQIHHHLGSSNNIFFVFVVFLIFLKIFLGILIVIITPLIPLSKFENYTAKLAKSVPQIDSAGSPITLNATIGQACKDLLHPIFVLSLAMTVSLLYFVENTPDWFIWGILRPIGVGFIGFFLLRYISLGKFVALLKNKNSGTISLALKQFLENMRKY